MNPTTSDILWYIFLGGMVFMMFRNGGCCGGHKKKQGQKQDHDGGKGLKKK